MKIKQVDIADFGKFHNFRLLFGDHFQVLYGANEDGKSTLMAFLKLLFYSDQGRSRDLAQNLRKKYQPWSGAPMQGSITLEAGGNEYHLSKKWGDTPAKDKTVLTNLDTGTVIPLAKGQEAGHYFLGLDLAAFERCCYIAQLGAMSSAKGTDDIAEKLLANLIQTGDEDVAQQEVLARLERAKYDLVSRSGTKGRLVEQKAAYLLLQQEYISTQQLLENQQELQTVYLQTKAKLSEKKRWEEARNKQRQQKTTAQIGQLLVKKHQAEELLALLPHSDPQASEEAITLAIGRLQQIKTLENQQHCPTKTTNLIPESTYQKLLQTQKEYDKATQQQAFLQHTLVPQITQYQTILQQIAEQKLVYDTQLDQVHAASQAVQHLKTLEQQQQALQTALQEGEQQFLEQQSALQAKQLQLQQDLYHQKTVLSTTKKHSPIALVCLVLGLLGALLAVLLGIWVTPVLLAGLALALPLLVGGSIAYRNTTLQKHQQEATFLETQVLTTQSEQLEQQLEEQKQQWKIKKQEQVEQLQDINKQITQEPLVQECAQTQQLKTTEQALQQLQAKEQALLEQLEIHWSSFPAGLQMTPIWQASDTPAKLLAQFTAYCNTIQASFRELLTQYHVNNVEELISLYFAQQEQKKQAEQIRKQVQELQQSLVDMLPTTGQDWASAKKYWTMQIEHWNTYQKLEQEYKVAAQTLELTNKTTAELQALLEQYPNNTEETTNPITGIPPWEGDAPTEEDLFALERQLQTPERNIEELRTELGLCKEQLTQMEEYHNALELAIEQLTTAQAEMRKSFSPILNQKTGHIFAQLTAECYDTITVDKDYQIMVKHGVHYREWQYLSNGTIDQAYLALRLAISEMISDQQTPFLLLDDLLMQYDDTRTNHALQFLQQYATIHNQQIILLTCHESLCHIAQQQTITTMPLLANAHK